MKISSNDQDRVLEALRRGEIDAADVSYPNLIDKIIIRIKKMGLIDKFAGILCDKRRNGSPIPFGDVPTYAAMYFQPHSLKDFTIKNRAISYTLNESVLAGRHAPFRFIPTRFCNRG